MKGCAPCPPVKVNVDAIVRAAKEEVLSEIGEAKPVEEAVHTTHVRGLGMLRLVPSAADFSGANFVVGYATLPPIINFASKLADEGILLPKIDKTLFRGVSTALTLGVQLFTGGSFLLGSLLGQLPTTLDSIADVAVDAIKKGRAAGPIVPGTKGIGQTPEEEIEKLRRDLERAGVSGHEDGMGEGEEDLDGLGQEEEEEMSGALAGAMVVD